MEPEQKSMGRATESQIQGHNSRMGPSLSRALLWDSFATTQLGTHVAPGINHVCPRLEQNPTKGNLNQEGRQMPFYHMRAC